MIGDIEEIRKVSVGRVFFHEPRVVPFDVHNSWKLITTCLASKIENRKISFTALDSLPAPQVASC